MASRLSQNRAPRECVNEMVWVDTRGFRARTRQRGKHRTEVTEATEGDWVGGRMHLGEDRWLTCGNTPKGKASHRGHGGHRGRLGLVDECTWVKIVGSRAGTRQSGKHRTEVTEATEGDWVGGRMHLGEDRWLTCGNTPKRKASHRGHGGSQRGIPLHPTGNGPPDTGTDTDTIRGHGTQNQIDGVRNFPFGSTR